MKTILLCSTLIFSYVLSCAQWSNNAMLNTPVMVKTGNQFLFNMIADGSGGLISIWGDDSNSTNDLAKNALYAQKLSSSGAKLWGAEGVKVTDSENNVSMDFKFRMEMEAQLFPGWRVLAM